MKYQLRIVCCTWVMACDSSDAPHDTPAMMGMEADINEERPYFENDGYMLPKSHSNILRAFTMTRPDEDGRVVGFNLDNLVTEEGDEDFCREGDFTALMGEKESTINLLTYRGRTTRRRSRRSIGSGCC